MYTLCVCILFVYWVVLQGQHSNITISYISNIYMHVHINYSIKLWQFHGTLSTLKWHKIMDNIVYFLHVRERTFESKIILQKPKDASLSTGRIIILLGLRQVRKSDLHVAVSSTVTRSVSPELWAIAMGAGPMTCKRCEDEDPWGALIPRQWGRLNVGHNEIVC